MALKNHKTLYISTAALLAPLAALGLWLALTPPAVAYNGIQVVLNRDGYFELRPPSRLAGPGTINTVERLSDGSLKLHPTCIMDKDKLTAMWLVSDTLDHDLVRSATSTFNALSEALSNLAAKTTGNQVKRVTISFRNMRIVSIADESIYKLRGDYLKDGCQEAVNGNLSAGATVCQTEEVLEADLVYQISFADGIKVGEKARLAEEISGSANLDIDTAGEDEMRGDNLYFGVKVGRKCIGDHLNIVAMGP